MLIVFKIILILLNINVVNYVYNLQFFVRIFTFGTAHGIFK